MSAPVKIAVLVSGGGTNLGALINAEQSGILKSGKIPNEDNFAVALIGFSFKSKAFL